MLIPLRKVYTSPHFWHGVYQGMVLGTVAGAVAAFLALLLSGCGGMASVDLPPDCVLPHNSPATSCNLPTPTYRVCWPGDGTYWILYDSGERVHQTLGKTAHVPILCHVAEDGTVTLNWKDGL